MHKGLLGLFLMLLLLAGGWCAFRKDRPPTVDRDGPVPGQEFSRIPFAGTGDEPKPHPDLPAPAPSRFDLPPGVLLIAEFRPHWEEGTVSMRVDSSTLDTWSQGLQGSGTWYLSVFLQGFDINGDFRNLLLPLGEDGTYAYEAFLPNPEGIDGFRIPLTQDAIDSEVESSWWYVRD